MTIPSLRSALLLLLAISHTIGLFLADVYGTIGSAVGFGRGVGFGVIAGALMSLPWFVILMPMVWFFGKIIYKYRVAFCLWGPIIVMTMWWTFFGTALLDAVAISSSVSGLTLLVLSSSARMKEAAGASGLHVAGRR